ncbi:MAG: S9 family peptidase, partial [Casimicrobiaceae bacterium]
MPPITQVSAAPVLPLRDFFRNAEQAAHQISPDGRFLSYTASYERRMTVFVRPLAGGEAIRVTSETARDISGYFWKGNRIVYVKDFGGDENFHVVVADLDGSALKDLTPGEHVRAEVVDDLEDDDDHLIL